MSDKVVFLAHRSDTVNEIAGPHHLACTACKNRTWLLRADNPNGFTRLYCAACHADAGLIGFAPEPPPHGTGEG